MSSQNEPGTKDDDLFEDAVGDLTDDIHNHLDNARAELPDADNIWAADAPNVLGVLNSLRSELDVEEATEELREARKQYLLADRADAFDNDDTVGEELDDVQSTIDTLSDVHEDVAALAGTVPELKETLDNANNADDTTENTTDDDVESTANNDSDADDEDNDEAVGQSESSDGDANDDGITEQTEESDDEDDENVPVHKPPANN